MTPSKLAQQHGATILEMVVSTGLTRCELEELFNTNPQVFVLLAIGTAKVNEES